MCTLVLKKRNGVYQLKYSWIIESLIYVMDYIRLEIAY
jgi:hypothetical protein